MNRREELEQLSGRLKERIHTQLEDCQFFCCRCLTYSLVKNRGNFWDVLYSTLLYLSPAPQIPLRRRMAGIEPRTVAALAFAVDTLTIRLDLSLVKKCSLTNMMHPGFTSNKMYRRERKSCSLLLSHSSLYLATHTFT